jgi:hypothetical protein
MKPVSFTTPSEDWMYGSLWRWHQTTEPLLKILSPWPIPGLPHWTSRVNEPFSEKELKAIHNCFNRGRPFGDEQWTEK